VKLEARDKQRLYRILTKVKRKMLKKMQTIDRGSGWPSAITAKPDGGARAAAGLEAGGLAGFRQILR
jgi:hypothetical protein